MLGIQVGTSRFPMVIPVEAAMQSTLRLPSSLPLAGFQRDDMAVSACSSVTDGPPTPLLPILQWPMGFHEIGSRTPEENELLHYAI